MISLSENQFVEGVRTKPVISILEIRDKHDSDSHPKIWVFLERIEKYRKDYETSEVLDASIQISFQLIHSKNASNEFKSSGFFGGSYSSLGNQVSLTSTSSGSGAVCLDLPKGQRIGTYLMNEIVNWAKRWPDAEVREIELLPGQAWEGNKLRRNRFYEQFGIKFVYSDSEKRAGKSIPMKANELNSVETWKQNITEVNPIKFASIQLGKIENLEREFTLLARNRNEFRDELCQAYAHPIFWCAKTVLEKHWGRMLCCLLVGAVLFRLWEDIAKYFI